MRGEADAVVRAVIEKAKEGDMLAAKIILDRVAPLRKGRPIEIDIPAAKSAGDIANAMANLIIAMAAGEITPDEAATVASVIEVRRRTIETLELDERLRALEDGKSI